MTAQETAEVWVADAWRRTADMPERILDEAEFRRSFEECVRALENRVAMGRVPDVGWPHWINGRSGRLHRIFRLMLTQRMT